METKATSSLRYILQTPYIDEEDIWEEIAQRFFTFTKKIYQKIRYHTPLEAVAPWTKTQQPPMETKETSTTALHSITDSSQAHAAEHHCTAWTRTAHLVQEQWPKENIPVIPSCAEA